MAEKTDRNSMQTMCEQRSKCRWRATDKRSARTMQRKTLWTRLYACLCVSIWASSYAFAVDVPVTSAQPEPASAQQEIAALIGALEQSTCQFQRNGDWHTAQEAARHLQRKYRALQQRAEVISAEQFIAQAATRSSLSGRPYQVQCPGQTVQGSGEWLLKKLQQLRHPAA